MLPAARCLTYWLLATLMVVCLATNCAGAGCPPPPINCGVNGLGEMRWGKRALTEKIGLRDTAFDQMARQRRTYPESLSSPKYRFRELLRRFTRNENH